MVFFSQQITIITKSNLRAIAEEYNKRQYTVRHFGC